jgi:flavin-dependent dehydrogenase
MQFDVIIIGAGPAGATTALLLAQAGWSVAIVEKKTFPRRKVCGEFISATSLPLLEKLGIADFYLEKGGPQVQRVGFYALEHILTAAMPAANNAQSHWGRALGREHLDTLLLQMAQQAGATVWQPWELVTLHKSDNTFHATLTANEASETISARIAIMANGSWERSLDTAKLPAKDNDLLAFKAHFTQSNLTPDLMPLLAFPGGYGGMVNTDTRRVTLSCCVRRDVLLKTRRDYPGFAAGEAVLQHITRHNRGVRMALNEAVREASWLSAGPIRPGIREGYKEGIFYVGNHAGEAHPVVAEGISMALQSGWLLAQALLKHRGDVAAAGAIYSKQWRSHFATRIHAASVFAHYAMLPWAVNATIPILKLFPVILTLGAKLSGKIKQVVPATSITPVASEMENTI